MKNQKLRIAVLYGGRSGEHEISLVSATSIIQHLDRSQFDVIPIGIDKQGGWFLGDDVFLKGLESKKILQLQADNERLLFDPDSIGKSLRDISPASFSTSFPTDRLFDVVFPAIHGTSCEDGVVQGLLELSNVPYVGCGVLSSAVGMDKDVSKRLAVAANVAVSPYHAIKKGQWERNETILCEQIIRHLRFPVFVKPANTGSSVGVRKVHSSNQLASAISQAFEYDTKVVVEQGIDAIELEVAVLESLNNGEDPIVSVVGEVRPSSAHEFYSYAAKYLDEKGAELMIPAEIPTDLQIKAQQVAKHIFLALDCEGMARVDLFLDRHTHEIYFNEINTIPGFTSSSMYPKMIMASGIPYSELLTHLIKLAMQRHARKNCLKRDYSA